MVACRVRVRYLRVSKTFSHNHIFSTLSFSLHLLAEDFPKSIDKNGKSMVSNDLLYIPVGFSLVGTLMFMVARTGLVYGFPAFDELGMAVNVFLYGCYSLPSNDKKTHIIF